MTENHAKIALKISFSDDSEWQMFVYTVATKHQRINTNNYNTINYKYI